MRFGILFKFDKDWLDSVFENWYFFLFARPNFRSSDPLTGQLWLSTTFRFCFSRPISLLPIERSKNNLNQTYFVASSEHKNFIFVIRSAMYLGSPDFHWLFSRLVKFVLDSDREVKADVQSLEDSNALRGNSS